MISSRIRDFDDFFVAHGCRLPEIALLQPAGPIIDAAGEDIRRRIFITTNEAGEDLCLRPEFTIPVCLQHLASKREKTRYGYVGTVFRQRDEGAHEFLQAGCEDIGAKNKIAADARTLDEAALLLRQCEVKKLHITFGDQAIFSAVLVALGLPKAWRARLLRNFGDEKRLSADLDRLSGGRERSYRPLPEELAHLIKAGKKKDTTNWIDALLTEHNLGAGGRSAKQIAARLFEKAELAKAHLSAEQRQILDRFLGLEVDLTKASAALWRFSKTCHISLGEALENFDKRAKAIDQLNIENAVLRYHAGFGRRLDYYTGFIFEIRSGNKNAILAGGGRYDHLLNLLGAKHDIPAIGYSLWLDRIKAGKKQRNSK